MDVAYSTTKTFEWVLDQANISWQANVCEALGDMIPEHLSGSVGVGECHYSTICITNTELHHLPLKNTV